MSVVDWLIRRAQQHPYFHLVGTGSKDGNSLHIFMRRWWLLGHGTHRDRREGNQPWGRNPPAGWLHEWLSRHVIARVHQILRSDLDRDLHDHPSWSISVVLRGGYWEVIPAQGIGSNYPFRLPESWEPEHFLVECSEPCIALWRGPGTIVFRRATQRHRVVLPPNGAAWSLFILGRKSNEWGFYTPTGKVPWRLYESMHS